MLLSSLYLYPVKSLPGISVDRARLTPRGLAHDRRFMIVDAKGVFLSQRSLPRMTQILPVIREQELFLKTRMGDSLGQSIPLEPKEGQPMRVRVWDDEVNALAVSGEADQWLSAVLERPCRLVFMPDDSKRPVETSHGAQDEVVSFADGYPYLVVGTASMELLSQKMDRKVEEVRFRPNLIITTEKAHTEDSWEDFGVGEARFRALKACARCAIPTLDPETGEADPQVTRTLAGYRRHENQVYFGQNAILLEGSHINVGDQVKVLSKRKPEFIPPTS